MVCTCCSYSMPGLRRTAGNLDVDAFAARLWGDIYFNQESRKFTRKQADPEQNRTFVHFILEPLYKLYSQVISEETDSLKETLKSLGIQLKPVMYKMDVRPLLKAVLDQFFGPAVGLVDMITEKIPSPIESATDKVKLYKRGQRLELSIYFKGGTVVHWSNDIRVGATNEVLRSRRSSNDQRHQTIPHHGCTKF